MEYFNKFRTTVTQVAAQVSNALPGNPLTREYEIGEQGGTAGPGLYWKVYKGSKKSTKQPVSVWIFDKKDIERWPKEDREVFLNLIKRGVSQLTRLRHPRLLVIEHPIEESRDSLAFTTEPVFASLANCLGRMDNMATPNPVHLVDFKLLDVEVKHGLLQLGEALAFLHIDAKMLHRNICPESVIINDRGAWKLGGFDFSMQGTSGINGKAVYESLDWNERIPSICQPSLDYLAPEYIVGGRCDPYSDIYSLGLLSYAVFNQCRPPMEHKNTLDRFRKNIEMLKSFPVQFVKNIPPVFCDDFKMCLNYTPDLRPDATQFTRISYFDDHLIKALNYFESLMQMDNNQKMQFFKSLPTVLAKFDKRPLLQKVVPYLSGEFGTPDLIPFILPSIFLISELASRREFTSIILPQLIPVFSMEKPYQIALLLLQKMELLLEKATEDDVKRYILPLIYSSISSDTTRIQELCLNIVPNIGKLVDRNSMKNQLLPKLLKLATDGGVLAVRVQALVCLGKLLPTLESWMVTEQVLPILPKINSKEPGVLMAILGIYKLTFDSETILVNREQLAKSALPFLIASCVENTLNLGQFEQYILLIKNMLARVEKEQRNRLQQLSAGQEEQRSVPNFEKVLKQATSTNNIPQSIDELGDMLTARDVNGSCAIQSGEVIMSLDEKKRLAAEQENSRHLRSQQPLQAQKISELTAAHVANANTFTNFNTFSAISGMDTKSGSVSRTSSPFDSLFDPLTPSTTVTTTRGHVDVSDFMPSTTSSVTQTASSLNHPVTKSLNYSVKGPFSTGGYLLEQQFNGLSFSGGQNPMVLPQPPRSSNMAVQRPVSSLDTLLSLGVKPSQQPMAMQNGGGIPMTMNNCSAFPISKPSVSKKNDPFADLLG